MSITSRYLAGAIGLALGTLGTGFDASVAQAQEMDEGLLEEVIVTASRREEALQDVAMAISVIDVQDFADAGKTRLADILPFVPGVTLVDGGATFGNGVIVRGINAFGSGGIGTYIDEIPYGSQTLYSSGGAPVDGTLLDLDSLNVLKGPQGTLYGASAMGGLLRFKTRDPSLSEWGGDVSTDLSSTSGGGWNQLYRASANGPLVTDTLGISFTAFWNEKDGYIDNVVLPKEGWDEYEYYGGSGSVLWQPTEKLSFKFQGLYQNSTQDGLATVQANGLDDFPIPGISQGEPIYGRYQTGEGNINPSEFETWVVGLTVEYDFGPFTLTSVTSSQDYSFSQTADFTPIYAPLADLFFPENAPHTSVTFVQAIAWEKVTQEFRLTSDSNKNFEWLVGAFYQDEEGSNSQVLNFVPAEPSFFFVDFPSTYEETSLFATGTFYFTDDIDASLGIRYSDTSMSVELDNRDTILLQPLPFNEVDDDVTTYLGNIRWRASENTSYYARVASGFRPGGANFVLIDPSTGQSLTDPAFSSDELWSYELGVKGRTADGRFGYEVGAFYIDWSDYQVNVIRGGLSVAGNAEAASSKGIEAQVNFAPTDALTVAATISYIDAQLDANEPDLGGADGDPIPGSPEWAGTISFNYGFNVAGLASYLAGSWRYNGEFTVGYPGFTQNGQFFPPSQPFYEVSSYDVLDLRVGFTTENFDVSLYATNLTDNDDWTAFGTSFTGFSNGTPLRPRTIGVVARYKF